jgi:glycosyltransferase involved in cell wall biosynthesis
MNPVVAVYVVTYRRPTLLQRALQSVMAQSLSSWQVRVINDDPADPNVGQIVESLGDSRVRMFEPSIKRGPARAFNEVFKAQGCEFAALLEDDNWWEPGFLEEMVSGLRSHPEADIACGNERIWKEMADGGWLDTGRSIWSFEGWRNYETSAEIACGSAKICNSSMLVRRAGRPAYLTPDDIPVDVTEHFRERVVKQPVVLCGEVLVNYAETLSTHRATRGVLWGEYQAMLIASVFESLRAPMRKELATQLFASTGAAPCPRATALISAAFCSRAAGALWQRASLCQRLKFLLGCLKRPLMLPRLATLASRRHPHWTFLVNSSWNGSINTTFQPRR